MDLFFRILRHLLPDAEPWRIRLRSSTWKIGDGHKVGDPGLLIGGLIEAGRMIDRLFDGLSKNPASARNFIDLAFLDQFPATTREIEEHEFQFGLLPVGTLSDRRDQAAAAWKAQGDQDPHYLQDILQTAGFAVYVHEWWESGPPYVARDPRLYTTVPLIGEVQCGEPLAQCGEPSAGCNAFLANEPGYLVNENWTMKAPPPVPDDSSRWPGFLYVGGETFPELASVPATRRREFERLLLKHFPLQHWIVTLVTYD